AVPARLVADELTYVATVVAERDAIIAAPFGGRLETVEAAVGDVVARGQRLAQLRDEDATLATVAAAAAVTQARARLGGALTPAGVPEVAAARAQLDVAADGRKRLEALADKGSASAHDLVRARTQEDAARAQLDAAVAAAQGAFAQARQLQAAARREGVLLRETALRAPFAGVVAERFARAGEVVPSGGSVVRVVDPSSVRVELDVPQHEQGAIVPGAAALVEAGDGAPWRARITRVAPGLTPGSRTRSVHAAFDSPGPGGADDTPTAPWLPGARVRVRVEVGAPHACALVPRAAIRSVAGAARAFFVDGGRASERLLDVVRTDPDGVLVTAAAKAGDLVVLDPPRELRDGDEVAL
ncbi:MAG: efflux RND transporter periplasmic adaptor subunit, partial [Gemmatimonadaceae bacterium]|nr:efflux RND transporter periplasmic adaptor subunit [Gemmatimonadaceae bacterium]MCU0685202.1 efflux RND transporter periplasmic adaptor subunit [Polyangiaceae bacterium]